MRKGPIGIKWSLNRGGLLIEVKMHGKATIGIKWFLNRGGLLIEVKPQLGPSGL